MPGERYGVSVYGLSTVPDGTTNVLIACGPQASGVLFHLFAGEDHLKCLDAADADDDGAVVLSDAIFLLTRLFGGGPPPPTPGDRCGTDPTDDLLGCTEHGFCSQE